MKRICLLLVSVFLASTSNACECFNRTFSEEVANTDKIFIGTVLTKKPVEVEDVYYLFAVSQKLKGDVSDTITVRTGFGGPDCGMQFETGKTYIVFSSFNRTSRCSRTSLISQTFVYEKLSLLFQPGFLNSIGNTTDPVLSDTEACYFNLELLNERNSFDFSNKKIVFFLNDHLVSKQQYFKYPGEKKIFTAVIFLTTEEKKKANNSDAIIVSGRKRYIDEAYRKKIIRKFIGEQ